MKNHQKGFIGIVVIFLVALAVIGGGAYLYTQKESSKDEVINAQKDNTQFYTGVSYGFSYPSDWDIWEANPVIGLTIAYPKSKADQVINKTISTTERINISLLDNKDVDLTSATKVTLNGEVWYMKTYKGPFDGGSESESVSYFKVYNSTKYVEISSGMSNKTTVELIASSWKQG